MGGLALKLKKYTYYGGLRGVEGSWEVEAWSWEASGLDFLATGRPSDAPSPAPGLATTPETETMPGTDLGSVG